MSTPKKWTKEKAKDYFLTNDVSLSELAKKSHIPLDTLKGWSSREKWADQKHQFNTNLTPRTQEKLIEKLAEKKANQAITELVTKDFVLKGLYQIALAAERDSDKNKAYELLGKHLKMFTDKVEQETRVKELPPIIIEEI